MDSLTQIVLGAACGEAVLGKKIGNKALLFGAIGGTIPDLDVFVGNIIHGNQIDAMLFHRGFMHSILFSILGAFVLGLIVFKLYDTGKRFQTTTLYNWVVLFFVSLVTHPLLDCFTPYGTQLFVPFSNYRVAFNNIAVVDPIYTLPFLVCLIVLMFFKRNTKPRKRWLNMAFGISSIYMLFTIGNKLYVDSVFKKTLKSKNIIVERFSTQPTLLNNVLWYGIVETATNYQVGLYSIFDSNKQFNDWLIIPKQRDISASQSNDIEQLSWFSNNYYNVIETKHGEYEFNDLRYPLLDAKDPNSSVFKLHLYTDEGRLNMNTFKPNTKNAKTAIAEIWERIKGY